MTVYIYIDRVHHTPHAHAIHNIPHPTFFIRSPCGAKTRSRDADHCAFTKTRVNMRID